jgi:hypothetical protein
MMGAVAVLGHIVLPMMPKLDKVKRLDFSFRLPPLLE